MDLRQQVMVNQLAFVAGCSSEQAKQLLTASKWHLESALSMFFQELPIPACQCQVSDGAQCQCRFSMVTPANTPVTPPSFPDALSALAKLSAGSDMSGGGSKAFTQSTPASSSNAASNVVTSSMYGSPATMNQKPSVVATQSMVGMVQSQPY